MSIVKEVLLENIDQEKVCPKCQTWRFLRKIDATIHAFVCIKCNTTQLVELKGKTDETAI